MLFGEWAQEASPSNELCLFNFIRMKNAWAGVLCIHSTCQNCHRQHFALKSVFIVLYGVKFFFELFKINSIGLRICNQDDRRGIVALSFAMHPYYGLIIAICGIRVKIQWHHKTLYRMQIAQASMYDTDIHLMMIIIVLAVRRRNKLYFYQC